MKRLKSLVLISGLSLLVALAFAPFASAQEYGPGETPTTVANGPITSTPTSSAPPVDEGSTSGTDSTDTTGGTDTTDGSGTTDTTDTTGGTDTTGTDTTGGTDTTDGGTDTSDGTDTTDGGADAPMTSTPTSVAPPPIDSTPTTSDTPDVPETTVTTETPETTVTTETPETTVTTVVPDTTGTPPDTVDESQTTEAEVRGTVQVPETEPAAPSANADVSVKAGGDTLPRTGSNSIFPLILAGMGMIALGLGFWRVSGSRS